MVETSEGATGATALWGGYDGGKQHLLRCRTRKQQNKKEEKSSKGPAAVRQWTRKKQKKENRKYTADQWNSRGSEAVYSSDGGYQEVW